MVKEAIIKSAEFSECGKYRYLLKRDWSLVQAPSVMCIGLNPSTAGQLDKNGEEKDDPTITMLIKTLSNLGFGDLKMCNLYALISSKPDKLFSVPDALGLNDEWLQTTSYGVQEIVFCWGSFKNIDYRAKKVINMFPDAKCFGKNSDGTPMHPMSFMWQGIKMEDRKLIKYRL